MCQTGQTILMSVSEGNGGISLQRLDRLVLKVQLYLSLSACVHLSVCVCMYRWASPYLFYFRHERASGAEHGSKHIHSHIHAHIQ